METQPKAFTLMVVPDRAGSARRYRIPRWWIAASLGLIAVVGVGSGTALWHYTRIIGEANTARTLRNENLKLRSEIRLVQEKVNHFTASLERVERMDAKLRMLTQVSDPQRNLAIGPLAAERLPLDGSTPLLTGEEGSAGVGLDEAASDNDIELLHASLDNLNADGRREEASLSELHEYFEDQKTLLAAMPSVWPARGWVTSGFGSRSDPFTGDHAMHMGLDIAAELGTKVMATADGTVVFAGAHGGYGNVVVIDNGFGVNSRFGHLSEVFVKVGQQVKRGVIVGAIGNTGRSTGPHLHYEVRVNGIPQDPRKFILD